MAKSWRASPYMQGPDVKVRHLKRISNINERLKELDVYTEGDKPTDAAKLFKKMIDNGDTTWLGICGIFSVWGFGGYAIDLMKKGFVNVICSTGAQEYHDLHLAYDMPMKWGNPNANDDELRKDGTVRIYDVYIKEKETLMDQDEVIRNFLRHSNMAGDFSSATFNYKLGKYVLDTAPHPERSFVAQAAELDVPIFWDSLANHSIGMNIAKLYSEGKKVSPNPSRDILESAAIVFKNPSTGFIELGGGGPKNFIQQTGPTLSQIFGINFDGADRGLQITLDKESSGSLSGCKFSEGVTWGKYKEVNPDLVQVIGNYRDIAPYIFSYVNQKCKPRELKRIMKRLPSMYEDLQEEFNKIKNKV